MVTLVQYIDSRGAQIRGWWSVRAKITLSKYVPSRRDYSHDHSLLVDLSILFAQIWDLRTYKLKNDLPGHTDEVYCVDFVADKIVSGGRDRTVKM